MTIFHDTLRGLHNVLVFRHFLKCDFWIFGMFMDIIPEKLPTIET